jgi:hypothetical protein
LSPANTGGTHLTARFAGFHSPLVAQSVASYTSIEPSLEPMELFEGIGKGRCKVCSGFAVHPVCLY